MSPLPVSPVSRRLSPHPVPPRRAPLQGWGGFWKGWAASNVDMHGASDAAGYGSGGGGGGGGGAGPRPVGDKEAQRIADLAAAAARSLRLWRMQRKAREVTLLEE